ncbi:MAG TPA: hypothetical protein VGO64_05380 [Candidatus Limnocylindrales bacterium]|nr:hypothetical protein [Candidatus Limnocylindrales bacterium]
MTNGNGQNRDASQRDGLSRQGIVRLLPLVLAAWFVVISVMRLALLVPGGPGFDGRLYRAATVAWLNGGDPWAVSQGGVYFAAPPPSLIPMIPFALLPEGVAIGLLLVLAVGASIWAIRRLEAPIWWLAFPPLVDAIWNANPHVFVVPLVLAGLGPLAVIVKVYAGVPLLGLLRVRALLLAAVLIAITAPFLPWARFVNELPTILLQLRLQSDGGLSITALPMPWILVAGLAAIAALVVIGRERAAWLAIPVLWPSTQWYYASVAIPGLVRPATSLIAAAILAVPLSQGPLIAIAALALVELVARAGGPIRVGSGISGEPPRRTIESGDVP